MNNKIMYGILMFVIAPATLVGGFLFIDSRKYFFVCLLLIIYLMIPFFARFERRKPQAREIMIIAVMITIGVVGRAAFFMLPNFKPVLAIIIISGIALGREAGFFIGAMIAFVSNFMFGQGPWTPWQMFAMGVVGFLAGYLYEKNILKNKKWQIIVFGFFSAAILYGAIVDVWTILSMTPNPTIGVAITVYGAAIYLNIIHGIATVVFLFFLANPLIEKLDRVKNKYGMTTFT